MSVDILIVFIQTQEQVTENKKYISKKGLKTWKMKVTFEWTKEIWLRFFVVKKLLYNFLHTLMHI